MPGPDVFDEETNFIPQSSAVVNIMLYYNAFSAVFLCVIGWVGLHVLGSIPVPSQDPGAGLVGEDLAV